MDNAQLLTIVAKKLAFQTRWRRMMSGCYFASTSLSIVCSGAASILAGLGYQISAAVLAGSATVLIGLEKVLLFREKWTHHLKCAALLESLEVSLITGAVSSDEAARELSKILNYYAKDLPVELRPRELRKEGP